MTERWVKINSFEMGYLFAALGDERLSKMEKDTPKLYLQIMIGVTESYAYAKGHPWQKRAWKELRNYKARLGRILEKERVYEEKQEAAQV